jgi:C-terminal processing protease CtpA/Prc
MKRTDLIQTLRNPVPRGSVHLAAVISLLLATGGNCLAARDNTAATEQAAQHAALEAAEAAEAAAQRAQEQAAESARKVAEARIEVQARPPAQAELERAALERAVAENFTARLAEQEQQIAEAQRQVEEAQRAMDEASRALAEERNNPDGDLQRSRAELSRAHRALREASREVAMAHREAEIGYRMATRVQTINLGDRAVIGVLLGESSNRGVELTGVSPGGPAEKAGLKQGDVITSIRETDLTDLAGNEARDALVQTMAEVKPGEEIRIGFSRDGKNDSLMVKAEQREPSSWQSLIRLPDPPPPPAAPGAPDGPAWTSNTNTHVVVDRIVTPGANTKVVVIDDAALAEKIAEIEQRVESFQYMFTDEDGTRIVFDEEFEFDDEELSKLGRNALNQANMWFGLSHTAGLELASLNPGLGEYFKAERGVLVLDVKDSNSYGLKSGDVILSVAGTEVSSPAEMIRALRDIEPNAEFEIRIKRDRRDKTLKAVLPDNRLGALMGLHEIIKAPEPPDSP